MDVIQFKDVWEMYRIKFITEGKASWENFWALKGISFKAEKGETLGIIGENGAGKSTILKLIMEMLKPDRGEIEVRGKTSGLLELGAGFQPELTGRENVYLNAGLFGLSKSDIEEKYEEIANFAALGKFIDAPVKCYSQGMFVRLAFSIAIHVDPDTLLIDDTLAVGDEHFQKKCIKKIFELKDRGKTIVLITHDMNMLRRLCKRAIFLKDGRIIKDGPVEDVMPLYTQMVGIKEGVGILKKGNLNLIFNNGRLFINWKDKIITPNSGAYASFLVSDKWYSSLQADWEVKYDGENKVEATGKLYQIELTQIWKLELCDNYEIKWDIEMDLEQPLEIKEAFTNIMLTDAYTNWFTALEKGEFRTIEYKDKKWQPLLENNIFRRCVGVSTADTSENRNPSLIFELSDYVPDVYTQILNSDYLANCRVLQYKKMGLQSYSPNNADRFVYFSGKIKLDIPDINNYLINLEDESIVSGGKFRIIFENGKCILSYNGMNLTKADHMNTAIYANGRWHSSNLAYWEVKKTGGNKLVAKGIWPDLPLIQYWEIEATGEASFMWKVNLEVQKEIDIEQQHVSFMCAEDYKDWFSDYGAGEFFNNFFEYEMDMLQRYIPDGDVGFNKQGELFPGLSLRFSKDLNNFAKIFNSNFCYKARILRIDKIEPDGNMRFSPGTYPCFRTEAEFDKDKSKYSDTSVNILQNKRLKFVFEKGRGRIFWDGRELTRKLSLYTSLRSEGRWHDSASSALWKIEERDNNTIRVRGKWMYLPVIQTWEINLKEDNSLDFSINMRLDKEIEVERLQTNIMLSRKYSHWFADNKQGAFPLFEENVDDNWSCIWHGKGSSKYIGVSGVETDKDSSPSLIILPRVLSEGWFLSIVNSDIYHQGRVLQYANTERKILRPCEYRYFDGRIIIDDIPPV